VEDSMCIEQLVGERQFLQRGGQDPGVSERMEVILQEL